MPESDGRKQLSDRSTKRGCALIDPMQYSPQTNPTDGVIHRFKFSWYTIYDRLCETKCFLGNMGPHPGTTRLEPPVQFWGRKLSFGMGPGGTKRCANAGKTNRFNNVEENSPPSTAIAMGPSIS